MDARTYITSRQRFWAVRNQIPVDVKGWTLNLADNLFAPMGEATQQDFAEGNGNELGGQNLGKMHAVHSSSAAAVNLFEYWRGNGLLELLLPSLGLPAQPMSGLRFEHQVPILGIRGTPPHLDALLIPEDSKQPRIGVEVKLREPFPKGRSVLNPTYLLEQHAPIWTGIPNLLGLAHELAGEQAVGPSLFTHLNVPQLMTHILGLRSVYGPGFILVYIWCDVPGPESVRHREEVVRFSACTAADGINFRPVTYQELILNLVRDQRAGHVAYVDYLSERYL